jgi:phosphate butyryltransferase
MITRVEDILTQARSRPVKPRLAVAGSASAEMLEVVVQAHEQGLAESVLFGDEAKTRSIAAELSLDISPLEIVDSADHVQSVVGALTSIQQGRTDILCKGVVPTRSVLKGLLDKSLGFRTDRAFSHAAVFNVPGEQRLLIISDAGVNVQPDLSRKRDILLNSVDVAHSVGIERPKVAILSFVEDVTDSGISSQSDAVALTRMCDEGAITGCVVAGPYSLDVAISAEAARIKGVDDEVAGQADIIVMNDIGMGNILYKALLLWCKPVLAAVIMGAKVPVVSPSRADSIDTKLNSIALATRMLDWQEDLTA